MESRSAIVSSSHLLQFDPVIYHKFQELSGKAFLILEEHIEQQHRAFCQLITETKELKPGSSYYSDIILQQTIQQGLIAELKLENDTDPYKYLLKTETEIYEGLITSLKEVTHKHLWKMQQDNSFNKDMSSAIEKMKNPLIEKNKEFKKEIYLTLQQAAEECRIYLMTQQKWTEEKFPEFMDIFGCVISINACEEPYTLNKTKGYGVQFGHKARADKLLPMVLPDVTDLEECSLAELEGMVNGVIAECNYYASTPEVLVYLIKNDHYEMLNIIKSHFFKLLEKRRDYFILEEKILSKHLKQFKLKKSDDELEQLPIKNAKDQLAKMMKELDSNLLKAMEIDLKTLQSRVQENDKMTLNYMRLIKQEVTIATNLLHGPSLATYQEIVRRLSSMKIGNLEAKNQGIEQLAALNRAVMAYDDAVTMGKKNEKKEFERLEQLAVFSLKQAEIAMEKFKTLLETQAKTENAIRKKIQLAQVHYDGLIYRGVAAMFEREYLKYEKEKRNYRANQKKYNMYRSLPKILNVYGSIVEHCDLIQEKVSHVSQQLAAIPQTIQSMWIAYNEALENSLEKKDEKFFKYQKLIAEGLTNLEAIIIESKETLKQAERYNDYAHKKLQEVKRDYGEDVHIEFRGIAADPTLQLTDISRRHATALKAMLSIKGMSDALIEYKELVQNCGSIKEQIQVIQLSVQNIKTALSAIQKNYKESQCLAKMGIVKEELALSSTHHYNEAKIAIESVNNHSKYILASINTLEKKWQHVQQNHDEELNARPKEIFNTLNLQIAEVVMSKNAIETNFSNLEDLSRCVHREITDAKRLMKEKELSTKLRRLLLNAILNNLSLWKIGKWGGGINFTYDGKTFRIPHGVFELITVLSTTCNHIQWIYQVAKIANNRDALSRSSLRYRLFDLRSDNTTGKLYQIIKEKLILSEDTISVLEKALSDIPDIKMLVPESRHTCAL